MYKKSIYLPNHDLEEILKEYHKHQTYLGKDRRSGKAVFGKAMPRQEFHDDAEGPIENIQLIDRARRVLGLKGPNLLSVERHGIPRDKHAFLIHELEREAKPLFLFDRPHTALAGANQTSLLDTYLMEARMGAGDRNSGNYLIHPNGDVHSIDHEFLTPDAIKNNVLHNYMIKANNPLDIGVINKHISKTNDLINLLKDNSAYRNDPELRENFDLWTNRMYKVLHKNNPKFLDLTKD